MKRNEGSTKVNSPLRDLGVVAPGMKAWNFDVVISVI